MIFEEGKKIYSKRFPKMDSALMNEQEDSDEENHEPSVPYEEFKRHIIEDSVYVVDPQKMKERQTFINLAVELSSNYEVDMDITEYRYRVEVNIYVDDSSCSGYLKFLFAKLVTMCDRISHFANLKEKEADLTISLDFYTHTHYLSDRRVDFM